MCSFFNNLLIFTSSIIAYSFSETPHNNSQTPNSFQYQLSPNQTDITHALIYHFGEYDNIEDNAWVLTQRDRNNGWLLGLVMHQTPWGFQDNVSSITTIAIQGSSNKDHGVVMSSSLYDESTSDEELYWSFISYNDTSSVYPSCGNESFRSNFASGDVFNQMDQYHNQNILQGASNGSLDAFDNIDEAYILDISITIQYQLYGNIRITIIANTENDIIHNKSCYYKEIPTQQWMDLYITAKEPNSDFVINRFILTKEESNDDSDDTLLPGTTHDPTLDPIEEPTSVAPTTESPTTNNPTTNLPTTDTPTTDAPTSITPTIMNLPTTTAAPTTAAPTTEAPTTAAPTTKDPTAALPISNNQTTTMRSSDNTNIPITDLSTTNALTTSPTSIQTYEPSTATPVTFSTSTPQSSLANEDIFTTDLEPYIQSTLSVTIDSISQSSIIGALNDGISEKKNLTKSWQILMVILVLGGCILCTVILCVWLIFRKKLENHDHDGDTPGVINKPSGDDLQGLRISTHQAVNSDSHVNISPESLGIKLEEDTNNLLGVPVKQQNISGNGTEVDVSSFNTPGNVVDRDVMDLDVDDIEENVDGYDEEKRDIEEEDEEDMYEDDDVMDGDITTNRGYDNIVMPDIMTKGRFSNADEFNYNNDEDGNMTNNGLPSYEKRMTNVKDEGHY